MANTDVRTAIDILLLLEKLGIKGEIIKRNNVRILSFSGVDNDKMPVNIRGLYSNEIPLENFLYKETVTFELEDKSVTINLNDTLNNGGEEVKAVDYIEFFDEDKKYEIKIQKKDGRRSIIFTIKDEEKGENVEITACGKKVDIKTSNHLYHFVKGKYAKENELSREQMIAELVGNEDVKKSILKAINVAYPYYKYFLSNELYTMKLLKMRLYYQKEIQANRRLFQKKMAEIKEIDPDWEILPSIEVALDLVLENPLIYRHYGNNPNVYFYKRNQRDFIMDSLRNGYNFFIDNRKLSVVTDYDIERPDVKKDQSLIMITSEETNVYDSVNKVERKEEKNENLNGMLQLLESFGMKAVIDGDNISFINSKNESLPVTINGKRYITIEELYKKQLFSISSDGVIIRIKTLKKLSNGNNIISGIEYIENGEKHYIELLGNKLLIDSSKVDEKGKEDLILLILTKGGIDFRLGKRNADYTWDGKNVGRFVTLNGFYKGEASVTVEDLKKAYKDNKKLIDICVAYYKDYFPELAKTVDYYDKNENREVLDDYVINAAKIIRDKIQDYIKKNPLKGVENYNRLYLNLDDDLLVAYNFENVSNRIVISRQDEKIYCTFSLAPGHSVVNTYAGNINVQSCEEEWRRHDYTQEQEDIVRELYSGIISSLDSLTYDKDRIYRINNLTPLAKEQYNQKLYEKRMAELPANNGILPAASIAADQMMAEASQYDMTEEQRAGIREELIEMIMYRFKRGYDFPSTSFINDYNYLAYLYHKYNVIGKETNLSSSVEASIDEVTMWNGKHRVVIYLCDNRKKAFEEIMDVPDNLETAIKK